MRVVYTLVITLFVILNSIELSSQSDRNVPARPSNHEPIQSRLTDLGVSNEDLRRTVIMQKYTFPARATLKTKFPNGSYQFIAPMEYPVLITGDGFVVAKVQARNGVVRGIYDFYNQRVKINKNTEEVFLMTPEEEDLYPVDRVYRLPPVVIVGGRYVGRSRRRH